MNNIKKNRKHEQLTKEIKKNIMTIILKKFNHIFKNKNLINISHVNLSKNFSIINIYINFINQINEKEINKNIYILQKSENYIKNILKKNIYIKYIPKINFKYDNFHKYENYISNLIKKANKIL